ncbi:MAG: SDR family NAD(P)-dependent oxidoreductase [Gammaproteobacteria bacterium]
MENSIFSLKNKVIVITGSSRGIGKSIAEECAKLGAKVVISSRKLEACEAAADEINNALNKKSAFAVAANISNPDDLEALVNKTNDEFGKIDVLVCNAASNPYMGGMEDIPLEMFDKIMANNVRSNHILTNLVLPQMKARNDGSIIIVSSIGGLRGSSILGTYNMSKAADIAMVKNIAAEFGPFNIRANAIAPGLIKTDMAKALWENPKILENVTSTNPLRRIGEPVEIAGIAVLLASRAGGYINGETIVVDGGSTVV